MRARGPHPVAAAPPGLERAAAAPLDGIVGGQDDRPVAGDHGDDQAEQDLPGGQAGPGVAVEDAVVVGEVPLLAQAHDPRDRTDGAVAGRQEGSDGQELGLDPGAVGEQWSEGGQDGYDLRWQIHGGRSPRTTARMSPSIVADDPRDLPADLAKVEWKAITNFTRPDSAVARLGIKPGDVTDVIITHSHWDHADGADLFPRATV